LRHCTEHHVEALQRTVGRTKDLPGFKTRGESKFRHGDGQRAWREKRLSPPLRMNDAPVDEDTINISMAWNNTFPWKIRIAHVGANTRHFPWGEEVADF